MFITKRLSSLFSIFVLLVLFIQAPAAVSDASEADRVYINGNIYTVDEEFSTASAMAVKDGQFIYVGDDAGVKAYIGPLTFVFNLEGKTVIPGLHDAHVHIRYGERELYPRIPDIRPAIGEWASVKRMQQVIMRCLATGEGMRPGPEPRWLVLSGWMSDVWDPPEFHKELIDAVAPDNPVFISRYTHGSGANSKALELAGITRNTPDPPGGHIKKDKKGEPTGEFVERAPAQLTRLIPINAYERALKATGIDGKKARFALEHCQVLTAEDVPRLAKLGIVASMQPLHATEDMHFAESRIGPERLKYAYIWRTLLDLGVVVATGTDYSVSPYNPFYTLHAAVTRQDRENNPPGGWIPEQAMTREEALSAATMGGAYVMFAEDILGSIEVGKLADFVVIPVDYMTIPAEDIWKIEPDMTVIGGEVVYTRPVQAQK